MSKPPNTQSPPPPDTNHAPDPLELAELAAGRGYPASPAQPLQRFFTMATQGKNQSLDAIAVCLEVLRELHPIQRKAAVVFIAANLEDDTPWRA